FRTQPVDAKLLADTKSSMKYGFLMGLETAQNVAFSMIQVVVNTGGIEAVEDYYNTLQAVTPEHVQRAAEQVLTANRRTTMTMVQAAR
ncbi:MAG: insulinase family protein, partial [Gemmatimonadota bacterium]